MKRVSLLVAAVVFAVIMAGCSNGMSKTFSEPKSDEAPSDSAAKTPSTSESEAPSSGAVQYTKLYDSAHRFLVGKVAIIEGDEKEYPQACLWAVLEPEEPIVYASSNNGDVELDMIQLGSVATEGRDQSIWEPYLGKRVALVGKLKGQDWNMWHLTPCALEDTSVVGMGEGNRSDRRDEVAVAFATAIRTNYRIENGEYVHDKLDYHQYVSPTSELYEWMDGNDDGEEILILGNPSRVESVEVVDAIGDAYILDMTICGPGSSLTDESSRSATLAIVFNDDDLVEHAYSC